MDKVEKPSSSQIPGSKNESAFCSIKLQKINTINTGLLACNAVQLGEWLPTFAVTCMKNEVPDSSQTSAPLYRTTPSHILKD
jgi:hypothetical protein